MRTQLLSILGLFILGSSLAFGNTSSKLDQNGFQARWLGDKILTTKGNRNYVVDASALKSEIERSGFVYIKIYGADIWFVLSESKEIKFRMSKPKNHNYYVLAPIRNLNETSDSVDYSQFGIGYRDSGIVVYPKQFCTACATTTIVGKNRLASILTAGELKSKYAQRSISSVISSDKIGKP